MKSIAILIPTDYWNLRRHRGNGPSHRALPDILEALQGFGKVVTPGDELEPGDFAGLVIPGGADIDPRFYGQQAGADIDLDELDPAFDAFQLRWTRQALELGQPILGICRGLQVMNVAAGGTLLQHVPDHSFPHQRRQTIHGLQLDPHSGLARSLGDTQVEVNSIHHQALDRVAGIFQAVAWAPDGIVEAVENPEAPWQRGVQFHPEDLVGQGRFQQLFGELLEGSSAWGK